MVHAIDEGSVSRQQGNTPLKRVPSDYYPAGSGYWFIIPDGLDKGKKMFFRDNFRSGNKPEHTIVFVHGNPECSYSYRRIIDELERSTHKPFRIVAMDHVGFGLSDQATYEMVCSDHTTNLLELVRFLDLSNVTLVVHDWGGPIAIGAFLQEPWRVANLVILNTTVFPISDKGLAYQINYPIPVIPWSRFPSAFPNFLWGLVASYTVHRRPAGAFRLVAGLVIHILMSGLGMTPGREKEAKQVYRGQFSTPANARSSKQLVRQTAYWGQSEYHAPSRVKNDGRFYRQIHDSIAAWGPRGRNIGVRALIGRWDPLGKDEVIGQWLTHLPQLATHVQTFDDVGHFVNLEKPREIAGAIRDVAGG